MPDPSAAVQKAVYETLNGAITRDAVAVPVYDHVPQGSPKPYVVIESQIKLMADYLNTRKDDRTLYLSVWSIYRGQDEVLDINAQIETLLHDVRLTLDSGSVIRCYVRNTRTNRDSDEVTYMGQVELRLMTAH